MSAKVTIITALHNKGSYISETISSVLDQSFNDWEMIVVENGSADDGPQLVGAITDPRVRLEVSPRNGPGAARNHGLSLARGDWILFLDADDLLEFGHLENLLSCASRNPEATLIVSSWIEFSGSDRAGRLMRPVGWMKGRQEVLDFAVSCAPWALHSAMISSKILQSGIIWREECDRYPSEDSAFWFPVVQAASLAWCDSSSALYRKETSNSRNAHPDIGRWIDGLLRVIELNVGVLHQSGGTVSQGQIRSILRMLEEKYWIASRTGQIEAAERARIESEKWIRNSDWSGAGLILRHLFGIHISLVVEKLIHRVLHPVTNPSTSA